jgi:hypothetical protein
VPFYILRVADDIFCMHQMPLSRVVQNKRRQLEEDRCWNELRSGEEEKGRRDTRDDFPLSICHFIPLMHRPSQPAIAR